MRTLIILFLIAQPCLAQFEGVLSMRYTKYTADEPAATTIDLMIKNTNAAGALPEQGAAGRFILRGDKKVLWIVNDKEKSYMEISTASNKQHGKPVKGSGLTKTGKTRTIIGYACDEYLPPDDGEQVHIWATAKLGSLYDGMAQSLKGMGQEEDDLSAWQMQLMEMHLAPLLVETYHEGTLTEKQEVLKVEKKAIPASTFEAPAGYAKQDLGAQFNEMYKHMGERGGKMKDKDNPGMNAEMEKMLKQMKEHAKEAADSADDDDDDDR